MRTQSPPEPISDVIRNLEAAALDGHRTGQTWREFFAANVATITVLIRANPAGWPTVLDRLLALLTSGDTGGMLPVGDLDGDEAQGVVPIPVDDVTTEARCLWSPEVSTP